MSIIITLLFIFCQGKSFADNGIGGSGGRIGGGQLFPYWQDEASSDRVRARGIIVDTGSLHDNADGTISLHFASSDLVENTFVPYTGATKAVDLGSQNITTTGTATADVVDTQSIENSLGTLTIRGDTSVPTPTSSLQIVNKEYVDLAVSSLELTEYLSNADLVPDVGDYKSMDTALASADTVVSPDIIGSVGSPTTLFTFLTAVDNPHLDRFLAGDYACHVHLLKTPTGNLVTKFYYEIWRINAAGVDISLLGTSDTISSATLLTSDAPFDIHAHIDTETAIDTTDRIAVKWYGYEFFGAGSMTITLTVGDSADSHFSLLVQSSELKSIFVPYTGAESDVDLGAKNLTTTGSATADVVDTQFLEHSSGGAVVARDDFTVRGTIKSATPHILQGSVGTGDYDTDPDVWILDLHADVYPSGIVISDIIVDCNEAAPSTDLDADLKYCDAVAGGAFPGGSQTVIAAIDTTTGNFSSTGRADTVPTGKSIYILINADPTSDTTIFHVRVHFKIPE